MSVWRGRAVCALVGLCVLFGVHATAVASPWTLPKDELSLSLGYDFQFADHEYTAPIVGEADIPAGNYQRFPLEGEFSQSTLTFAGRYGFTDKFEGAFALDFKQVAFTSQPYLAALPDTGGLAETRDEIVNFADTSVGAGDLRLAGRYNLHRSWWLATAEVQAKLPTGYEPPTGTTVARGDGLMDVTPAILLGVFVPQTSTFARADAGYNLRLGGPGHQALGGIKVGQFLGDQVILFGGISGAYTLFGGEPLEADNFIARDPSIPRRDFGPEDFIIQPLTLDKNFARVEAGFIFRLRQIEFQAGYNYVFAGQNIPALHSFSLASVITIPDATVGE